MQTRPDDSPLDWEERSETMPFWRHLLAGSLAGISEHIGMYPLDTVKTQMQAKTDPSNSQSIRQVMRSVVAERGFVGLFRGASVISAGCVPAHCGLFVTYEMGKGRFIQDVNSHQPMVTAACGAAASAVHDVIITPYDVIKQRLQLGLYGGPADCLQKILRTEGVLALYRSLPVTFVSNGPNTAVLAAVNESMKIVLGLNRRSTSADLPWYFLSAGIAGACAAAISCPLDVVKTRIQTRDMTANAGKEGVVQEILQKEGVRGFYRGLVPRVILATPAAALCWGTYESAQFLLSYCVQGSPSSSMAVLADAVAGGGEDDPLEWEHWDPLKVPLWKHCVAGSAAGVMEHVAMYPVDTVKTQMQAVRAQPGAPALSMRETVQILLREQGIGSFFRGCTAIGFGCIPAHIGLFGTYEISKIWLLKPGAEKEHAPLAAACCGALSTIVHDTIIVPMDVVKQRLQLGCYKSAWDCIVRTAHHEGVYAFYRSLPSTLAMECPFYAILVASNESLKLALKMEGPSRERSGLHWHFASAGLAGVIASAATQPFDLIKTRLQTQEILRGESSQVRYRGLLSTFFDVLRDEGIRGLYRGAVPRMVFAAPAAAMCWGTYEAVKNMLS